MDAIEAIFTRRSIRHFTDQPVPEAVVEQLLRAAMQAPSSNNGQPWHFMVITDRLILDAIPTFHQFAQMCREAQLAFVVCGDRSLERRMDGAVVDGCAATQNILIAAHALGLGAVWCGVYGNPQRTAGICQLLKLPDNLFPISLIPIGYPAEQVPPVDRYLPERVHWFTGR